MSELEPYGTKYEYVRMRRRDGILQLTLHTRGSEFVWGMGPLLELPRCFDEIGADPDIQVVILTGEGGAFIGRQQSASSPPSAQDWGRTIMRNAMQLYRSLLDIEVPMIAAVNGPAIVHAELALLCDIVLASERAEFRDEGHFTRGLVPGDGAHVVWPMLLGLSRARYFLLTGQTLTARDAHGLGLVAEVLSPQELLPRAWELARHITQRPPLTVRFTRAALTQELKRQMQASMGYGITLEALAAVDEFPI